MTCPLTAAELQAHPEYPHVVWDLPSTRSGTTTAGIDRGGPYKVAWEIHGVGPRHVCLIMGLGGFKSWWQRQTKDFGHTRRDAYSVLILDNIGIGYSDKPFMRYSTSNMARDVLEVLDEVEWAQERSVHIVGVSMGGMIAQELAYLAPERIASLALTSTAARLVNTIGYFENLRNRINMFIPRSIDIQLKQARDRMFTKAYLEGPDIAEYTVKPFPCGADRFDAGEVWKRSQPELFSRTGFLFQAVAAGWHHKSTEQLKEIAEKVGRHRICVIHGTEDKMITVPHAEVLSEELSRGAGAGNGVRKVIFDGQGHVIPIEKRARYNQLLEEVFNRGEEPHWKKGPENISTS